MIYDLLTESWGYGDIARRIAMIGSISLFAFFQVVRAFVSGRISGFDTPFKGGVLLRDNAIWKRWERHKDSGFWMIVGMYILATIVTATVAFKQLPDMSGAAEPTDLFAVQSTPSEIMLNWSSPEREVGPSCYVIYRDENPLPARPDDTLEIYRCNSTSLNDQDVERGKTYYYRIAASYRWEDLAISEEAKAITR